MEHFVTLEPEDGAPFVVNARYIAQVHPLPSFGADSMGYADVWLINSMPGQTGRVRIKNWQALSDQLLPAFPNFAAS